MPENKSRIRFLGTLLGLDERSRQHLLANETPEEIAKLNNLTTKLSDSLSIAANKRPSFRELAQEHNLQKLSESKYRANVKNVRFYISKDKK